MWRSYFLLQKTLCTGRLQVPDIRKVTPCLQRLEPDRETYYHREERTDDHEVAVEFEEASGHGHHHCGNGNKDRNKDEDGIRDRSCRGVSTVLPLRVSSAYQSTDTYLAVNPSQHCRLWAFV
jgi:hypothetical protein